MGFLEKGWVIEDNIIKYPAGLDSFRAWKFVQEAIYDSHLPVMRAIAYYLNNPGKGVSSEQKRFIRRFPGCAEDRMTLVANFSKLLFPLSDSVKRVRIDQAKGNVTMETASFLVSTKPVRVISTADHLYTALDSVSAELCVSLGTGYVSPDENYEKIRKMNKNTAKTRLFPMFSYHSVVDFVRVFPPTNDGVIHVRYDHGMTGDDLQVLFERLFELRTDRDWCDSYEEILC